MNLLQLQTLDELLAEDRRDPLELHEDPLALAAAAYNLWRRGGPRFADLMSMMPTLTDRVLAEDIKQYYKNRTRNILIEVLSAKSGQGASDFRRKLCLLVHNELRLTHQDLGLLHRLPYFYAEDLALDQVAASTDSVFNTTVVPATVEQKLYPLARILRSRRSGDVVQYWWRNKEDQAYMLPVRNDNVLLSLMDGIFDRSHVRLCFLASMKSMMPHQDHNFWMIFKPTLA